MKPFYCVKCGLEQMPGDTFCGQCGTYFTQTQTQFIPPAPPRRDRVKTRRVVIGILCAFVILVGACALIWPKQSATSNPQKATASPNNVASATTEPRSVSVHIKSPGNKDNVPWQTNVKGIAPNIPKGQELWLFVANQTGYFPQNRQPILVLKDKTWNIDVYIGQESDVEQKFRLFPVLIGQDDKEAKDAINTYFRNQPLDGMQLTGGMQLITPEVLVVRA
jgi:hypothetical protein